MPEITVDVDLPDLDASEVREEIARRAADLVIRRCIEHSRRRSPDEGSLTADTLLYRGIMGEIAQQARARLDQEIERVLAERIDDGTVADAMRRKIDSVLEEPVDKHGRSLYGGRARTTRIQQCLENVVRSAIIRHVDAAAKQAVALIDSEARAALGAALAPIVARLRGGKDGQ